MRPASRILFSLLVVGSAMAGVRSVGANEPAAEVSPSIATIDLSGPWRVRLDPKDLGAANGWHRRAEGTPIELPGIATEAGLGEPLSLEPKPTKEVLSGLHQRHRYVGPAWYTRTVEVPPGWESAGVTLCLERVIWESTLWINGQEVGSADSLSTPHRYDLSGYLVEGENLIAVRVDNRPHVDIGVIGHAYTDWTQTIWNGLIGRLELEQGGSLSIDRVRCTPQPDSGRLRVRVALTNRSGVGRSEMLRLQLAASNHDGPDLPAFEKIVFLAPGTSEVAIDYPIPGAVEWSEFNPALYQLRCDAGRASRSISTGIRTVAAEGRQLVINGRPSFLRGTLECCIFPKTGYPPTTPEEWDHVFHTAREYGLNHLRFHSWCPPEAAFASADRHGLYLQVELPNWTFNMGRAPEVDAFLDAEGERILEEYGHHPSLVLFSLGNELTGDLNAMDEFVLRMKRRAPHVLFTSTSYSFSERGEQPGRSDDFFITQKSKSGWVRGQGFLNQTKPNTESDYQAGIESVDVPLISHEVGQYHVYPNLAELPRYDGNLRALNFEAIAEDLRSKGRLDEAAEYTRQSAKLAACLYKEDIERALRTRGLSGIQLLDLHDFSGQGTATVGLLDAFWNSKGAVAPEEFRRFCGPVTPLLRMARRTWRSDEEFVASVEIANFGECAIDAATVRWRVVDTDGKELVSGAFEETHAPLGSGTRVGEVRVALDAIAKAARLTLIAEIEGLKATNSWDFWVYPGASSDDARDSDVRVVSEYSAELFEALADGKRVLFLPRREEIVKPLDGRFVPVFWSPVHFASQPGSVGALIAASHPALEDFPTDAHADWQWWELLSESTSVDLDAIDPKFPTIVRFIDRFNRNALPGALWEARVGSGRLLVCTLDVSTNLSERIVAAQLRSSLMAYMGSDRFSPDRSVDPAQLAALFKSYRYRATLAKGSSHASYPLSNLDDGDRGTFWHSDWDDSTSEHPYFIDLEMSRPTQVSGVEYTARPDMSTGRVREYRVEALTEDGVWRVAASGFFEDAPGTSRVRFNAPFEAERLRLVALSEVQGRPHCSIAELRPVCDEETVGVDELGLIEGFNTTP